MIVAGGWVQGFSDEMIDEVQSHVRATLQPLIDVVPENAAYVNEADYAEPNWESVFFGDNYAKLLAVKQTYDPQSLFNCWKCVGWSADE